MADTKVSALTQLSAQPALDDELIVVDKSDTTMAASGTDKRIQYGDLIPSSGASPIQVSSPANVATGVGNTYYVVSATFPSKASLTGVAYRVGTSANGNAKCALFNSAGTTRIAYRNTGQAQPTQSTIHRVPFDTGSAANLDPGLYLIALWFGNSAATFFGGRLLIPITTSTDASFPATTVSIPATFNVDVPFMAAY